MLTGSNRNCQHVVAKGPDEVEHHAAVSPAKTQSLIERMPCGHRGASKAARQCHRAVWACRCIAESVDSD